MTGTLPRTYTMGEMVKIFSACPGTIYRRVAERRAGRGSFPLPISQRGQKLLWLATDIESFLESQSNVALPVNVISTTAQRCEAKSVARQREATLAAATATLERHRIGRKLK